MRKTKKKEKRRKLRIRINPARSPLKLIMKNFDKNDKPMKKTVYKEIPEETPIGFVDRIDQLSRQVQMLVEEEESDEKQYQLLKMMFNEDVNLPSI